MAVKLVHIQSLLQVYTKKFFTSADEMNQFLKGLVKELNMDVIIEPRSEFCGQEGNLGLTGQIGLVTSHATIHSWDEYGYHMIDIYSCKKYDIDKITNWIAEQLEAEAIIGVHGNRADLMSGDDEEVTRFAFYYNIKNPSH